VGAAAGAAEGIASAMSSAAPARRRRAFGMRSSI
jgi:hypothetical protein